MPIDLNDHLQKKHSQKEQQNKEQKDPIDNRDDKDAKNDRNSNRNGRYPKDPRGNGFNDLDTKLSDFFLSKKGISLIIAIIIVGLFLFAKPYAIIKSGEVGIKVTTGKYNNTPLRPGIHFFIPGVQEIIIVDTRVRVWNFIGRLEDSKTSASAGILRSGAIEVMDSRGLPVSIELTVQYQLNDEAAPQTIARYGLEWESKIISPLVLETVRTVVGNYPAEDLPNKRNEIAKQIDETIRSKLKNEQIPSVSLSSVQLREITLPQNIRVQIEKVQEARQRSEQARLEVEIAKQEAEKKIALSKGEAEANIKRAEGAAKAILIESEAKSKSNKEIAQSLTTNLLRLREIETQAKFNEALKTNQNAQIFLTPGGAVPNIWLDSKSSKQSTRLSQ